MTDGRRLRRLVGAALADSFGLSLGWTLFSLQLVPAHGLAGLGLCNAAMLAGVALSAPAADRLSGRLDGRALLRLAAVSEALLRVGSFLLLLIGAPLPALALLVAGCNVAAWTGFAGMRAEVAAADPRGAAMAWYMVAVAATEAAGTATAALLPAGPDGRAGAGLLAAVVVCYGACLLPTWLVAGQARVTRVARGRRGELRWRANGPLLCGGLVMLLGSGPTLLAVGLAAELHGTRWVAGSALAFAAGSLLAPASVARLERSGLAPVAAWPALGVGMVAGWGLAGWHPAGLLAAQFLAGMCMSALEGGMDALVAARGGTRRGVTARLASAAALRAFGGAAAVAVAPQVVAEAGVGGLSVALASILAAATVVGLAWHRNRSRLVGPDPAAHPG